MKAKYYILLGLIPWVLQTCKHEHCFDPTDPDCANYNPCHEYQRPSARFQMFGSTRNQFEEFVYMEDSIFAGEKAQKVYYSSVWDSPDIEHTWYVGTEVFTGAQTPARNFITVTWRPTDIPITHVIKYQPNKQCDPDDDGVDSIVQYMHLVRDFNELRIMGHFRGAFENQNDSFDFSFWAQPFSALPPPSGHPPTPCNQPECHAYVWTYNFHNLGDTTDRYGDGINSNILLWMYPNMDSRFEFGDYAYAELGSGGKTRPRGYFQIVNQTEFVMAYHFLEEDFIVKGRKLD